MFVFCKAGYGVKTRLGGASPQPAADAPPAFDYVTLKTIGGNENDRGKTVRIFDAPGVRDAELVYTKVEVNFRCWR
jgi:hypothetical protein